ncbi:helix-turn-helix domain-containing protein [Methylobacterium radiotolerans]|uniref:helix-turn-helix domain-containing protein n=1 Tax=Methylobacterium radiotolerans TaxID=31998 RepID=UPI0009754264|nr:transcriptional regulator [Methylobacterium radiotolerans]ONF46447.1 XRE family transcriptional regulator [Methylobacterium radiotolerans]
MSDSFSRLMGGLSSAVAHAQGNPPEGTRVHIPEILDVAAIRERTGLAQPAFAATIGVKVGTLRNWEQKRRDPEGPARVLLALVDKRPQIVTELLGQSAA